MMRISTITALALLLLSACGYEPKFVSQVTRFHNLPQTQGATFTFLPMEQSGIEHDAYAAMVREELEAIGFKFVSQAPAAYGVRFAYRSDAPQTELRSRPVTLGMGFGYGYGASSWRYGGAWDNWPDRELYSTVQYPRLFELQMVDLKTKGQPNVFEGRAISTGRAADFSTISRCLIHSIFVEFPGVSGASREVVLPAASCVKGQHVS
jgi:hypothetical protein